MLNIFSCACWPSVCPLWRNVYSGVLPIFWVGCLFWCYHHKLFVNSGDQSLISHIFCKYFLPICGFSFPFIVSFAVQKFLSLRRSFFLFFVFFNFCFHFHLIYGDGSKKILLWFMSEIVLPLFSSRNFVVFSRTFRSLVHFELIFVYRVKEWFGFIF